MASPLSILAQGQGQGRSAYGCSMDDFALFLLCLWTFGALCGWYGRAWWQGRRAFAAFDDRFGPTNTNRDGPGPGILPGPPGKPLLDKCPTFEC